MTRAQITDPRPLAGRIAEQLRAAAEVLEQTPLAAADVERVARQLDAEVSLLALVRRALDRGAR